MMNKGNSTGDRKPVGEELRNLMCQYRGIFSLQLEVIFTKYFGYHPIIRVYPNQFGYKQVGCNHR
jgi:hypothetical protein